MRSARRAATASALAALALLAPSSGVAQLRGGEFLNIPPRFMPGAPLDRDFFVCRMMYERVRVEQAGGGWRTDYPYGEINLSIRFAELTKTRVSMSEDRREPNHYVVALTDDTLFECPFLLASDVGTVGLTLPEQEGLRQYLLKGGFLWVDDFWGSAAWEQWEAEISNVLDPEKYPIQDVALTDPILHAQFTVTEIPQITNIGFWRRSLGAETSERGPDSEDVHFRTIRDSHGRVMVVMTHNTDVADSWEREGEDPAFFFQFSPPGYALGINVLLYAMTH
jgi:hypothetical protein